jgi:hypothetical protein
MIGKSKEVKKSYKGMTGGWTKWGGRVYGVAARQDEIPVDWVCQSCAEQYPAIMPAYKFQYPKGEYIRVCAICYFEKCIRLINRLMFEDFI